VQLDRPATPAREVAPISTLPLSVGQRVSVIGFGAGLPAKVDQGAEITDVTTYRHYFGATTDTFGGNSGSPVFDEQGMLVGLHTRGQPDWESDRVCQRVARPESGYEDQQRVGDPLVALCEAGWPSPRLCDIDPTCGDQVCSPGESSESCPDDCPEAVCGDGYCEGSEPVECASDCEGPEAPAGWICPAEYYRDRAGCDCDCGARDLDCEDPLESVLNCSEGQVCNADGRCDDRRGRRSGGPLLCQASLSSGERTPNRGWLWWWLAVPLGLWGSRRAFGRSIQPGAKVSAPPPIAYRPSKPATHFIGSSSEPPWLRCSSTRPRPTSAISRTRMDRSSAQSQTDGPLCTRVLGSSANGSSSGSDRTCCVQLRALTGCGVGVERVTKCSRVCPSLEAARDCARWATSLER